MAFKLLGSPIAEGGRFLIAASAAPATCNQEIKDHVLICFAKSFHLISNKTMYMYCNAGVLPHSKFLIPPFIIKADESQVVVSMVFFFSSF